MESHNFIAACRQMPHNPVDATLPAYGWADLAQQLGVQPAALPLQVQHMPLAKFDRFMLACGRLEYLRTQLAGALVRTANSDARNYAVSQLERVELVWTGPFVCACAPPIASSPCGSSVDWANCAVNTATGLTAFTWTKR